MVYLEPYDVEFAPNLRVCYKPMQGVANGGCFMDVYTPENASGPVPLAIYLHGGAFILGGSSSIPYRQVRWLHEHGVAVASLEYRLLPHVDLPAIRSDILDAYRYVQTDLNEALTAASLPTIDPSRVSGWGASAGGTAVILFAADVLAASLPPLRAIVPVYPLADFEYHQDPRPRADFDALCASDTALDAAYKFLMQGECGTTQLWIPAGETMTPVHAARRKLTDSVMGNGLLIPLLVGDPPFASSSPLRALTSDFPPTYVLTATADELISPKQSYAVVEKLKAFGVDAVAGEAKGMGHGPAEVHQVNGSWPAGVDWWETAVEPSLQFALKYLKA